MSPKKRKDLEQLAVKQAKELTETLNLLGFDSPAIICVNETPDQQGRPQYRLYRWCGADRHLPFGKDSRIGHIGFLVADMYFNGPRNMGNRKDVVRVANFLAALEQDRTNDLELCV